MACHLQACLALKQFEYTLNVTEYVNENYIRIKEKFLKAIDYVEDINIAEPSPTDTSSRQKHDNGNSIDRGMTPQETKYLAQLLTKLSMWNPASNVTHREKRFISLFA